MTPAESPLLAKNPEPGVDDEVRRAGLTARFVDLSGAPVGGFDVIADNIIAGSAESILVVIRGTKSRSSQRATGGVVAAHVRR
jgi:hypothetical protein